MKHSRIFRRAAAMAEKAAPDTHLIAWWALEALRQVSKADIHAEQLDFITEAFGDQYPEMKQGDFSPIEAATALCFLAAIAADEERQGGDGERS